MFYELFTGHLPFQGSTVEITQSVLSDQPPPPSERATVPDRLDTILLKTLAKRKSDRYENTVYFRDELRALFTAYNQR